MTVENTVEEEFDRTTTGGVDERSMTDSANNSHNDPISKPKLEEFPTKQQMPTNNSNQNLAPCPLCDRKFLPDRLDKHLVICKKIKEKKRQLFDSVKKRAENLDKINNCEIDVPIGPPPPAPPGKSKPVGNKSKQKPENSTTTSKTKSNWRQQHQEFIKTIRAARGESINQDDEDANVIDQKSIPAGMIECPTCQRRFSIKAADRHIVWCAEQKNRKPQQPKLDPVQQSKNQEALERMKARTKYKPIPPGANRTEKKSGGNSLPRSRSTSTLSGSTIKSDSSVDSVMKPSAKTPTTTKTNKMATNNRKTRVISKSSENLASSSPKLPKKNLVVTGRTNDSKKRNLVPRTKPVTTNNANTSRITSKIDTGLIDRGVTKSRTEKSAPVMKFKEKFPNHNIGKSIIDQFQDIEQILRRNSTAIFDDSPKTVPGVRTGGMSPIKPPSRKEKSPMSKSETNLQMMGSEIDIKQRIDQYINNLQTEWPNGQHQSMVMAGTGQHPVRMARENSAGSDELRGSTSDSTDSGVGVIYASNGQMMLETVRESTGGGTRDDGKHSGASSKASARTFRAATIISPTMSDIEQPMAVVGVMGDQNHRHHLLLRNGSLNDIELLNGGSIIEPVQVAAAPQPAADTKPRFCHQCGTKYPSLAAKFCYECGSQRFNLIS